MGLRNRLSRAFASARTYARPDQLTAAELANVVAGRRRADTFDVPDAEPYDDTATYEDTTTFVGTIGGSVTSADDDSITYTATVAGANSWTYTTAPTTPEP